MNQETKVSISGKLLSLIQSEESLSAQYVSMQSIIVDGLKRINDQRKENRQSVEALLKSVSPVEAVELANGMLPARESKDAAERKRAQKRRDWLKARLSSAFAAWDFSTSYSHIVCEYVGDASVREARVIMSAINQLKDLEIDIATATVESVADALKASAERSALGRIVHTDPAIIASKTAILEKLAAQFGFSLVPETGETSVQVTEKVKVARAGK